MTTDRHERHDDRRLAAAYRDLARERTPAGLDEAVLRMAAREARTPYGLARTWTRPVAWAATIGLSLALVLELSRIDDLAPLPADDAVPVSVPVPAPGTGPGAPATPKAERRPAMKAEPAPVQAPTRRSERAAENVDLDVQEEVAAQSDLRDQPSRAVSLTGLAAAEDSAALREKKAEVQSCDDGARGRPASWYACIIALRDAGLVDAAADELDALQETFPDFPIPDESR